MLKVVAVTDKNDSAIDRLGHGVNWFNGNLEYMVNDVHPKRPSDDQLKAFERDARDADIIHVMYFRTGQMLLERYPWMRDKKLVLSHFNPYSIFESDWADYDLVTAPNKTIQKNLEQICKRDVPLVPITIDAKFWQFNNDWKPERRVLMVANRIESKKGILPVAIACGELDMKFTLVGAISDRAYFEAIMQSGHVEYHEQITDEALKDLYYQSGLVVCNSIDDFESGTMPILEAMLCGTPVLTRNVGHVPDLSNGVNLEIHEGDSEDVQGIISKIENLFNDKRRLEEMRQSGWNTAKAHNHERRAYLTQKLYRSLYPGTPVSVIVPVYDKPEVVRACLNAIAAQAYPNLELIVCDDNSSMTNSRQLVSEFANTVSFPVRYINTGSQINEYALGRARNMGIVEATGDILVFCDQRMIMQPTCISELVSHLTPKTWVYGNKGAKKDFVENLSAISRHELIAMGMFNERITGYGGMSQEIRSRAKLQGYRLEFVESAKAQPMGKSRNKYTKRQEIIAMKNLLYKVGL